MPNRQSYQQYIVVKGDTLAAIARRFGTDVGTIAVTSGVADPNKIKVGQVLSIPIINYDGDDLSEVKVNVRPIPTGSAPKTPPTLSVDQYMTAVAGGLADWLKPPKLWFVLAAAAGVGYYLFADSKRRRG